MRNLELNVTSDEIAKIVKVEKKRETKDSKYLPKIYLGLMTFAERDKLNNYQKNLEFYKNHIKECKEFEIKINEMLEAYQIEYRDFFEGDYIFFYKNWIEDEGLTFDELWEMMKPVIEEYEYPVITYHILFSCFENEYI